MNTIIQKASCKKALFFTALFAALYALINDSPIGVAGLLQITNGANILDFAFGYSTDKALTLLTALGGEGRSFYLSRIVPLDFPFPLSYMLCFTGWMALLLKQLSLKGPLKYSLLLPLLAMAFDWMENLGIIFMLKNYPALPAPAVAAGSIAGVLKFIFTAASIGAILALLVMLIHGKRRGMGRSFHS